MKYVEIRATTRKKKKRVLTNYVETGGVIRPTAPTQVTSELENGVYSIDEDMSGIYFVPENLKTDDLLKFKDKRQNTVLNEINSFWNLKSKFDDMGYIHKRGMLLYGSPGCGKSCLVKQAVNSISDQGDIVFIVKNPYYLKQGLKAAKEIEPNRRIMAVLEDVDDMVRGDEQSLLGLFDGDSQEEGILIVGTTNYLDRLPPRMTRTGRFDRVIEIGNPDAIGRKAYFESKLKGKERKEVINYLVKLTSNFNFSQMKEVIVSVYCLGYTVENVVKRIKGGFETLKEEFIEDNYENSYDCHKAKDEYLEEKIDEVIEEPSLRAKVKAKLKKIK